MQPAQYRYGSILLLVGMLICCWTLDRLVDAGATRTETYMDQSWAWTKVFSRLFIVALGLVCAGFVLRPARPSRLVAAAYVFSGALVTMFEFPNLLIRFGERWLLALQFAVALPLGAAFLIIIGIAAFARPYVSFVPPNA